MTAVNGAVVWSAKYSSFGKVDVDVASTITNNLRFAGQYYDSETGLLYNWHRYYDLMSGRYLTSDPIGLEGGINFYTYSKNNPLRYIDPEGLACGTGSTDGYIPDEPFDFYFKSACEWHDECYRTRGKSKTTCDWDFYNRMMSVCYNQLFWKGVGSYGNCAVTAGIYYGAVWFFGKDAYNRAQKKTSCMNP